MTEAMRERNKKEIQSLLKKADRVDHTVYAFPAELQESALQLYQLIDQGAIFDWFFTVSRPFLRRFRDCFAAALRLFCG